MNTKSQTHAVTVNECGSTSDISKKCSVTFTAKFTIAFLPVVTAPAALELVEDAVGLVERAQLAPQVLVHLVRLHRLGVHVQVPHLHRQVVARDQVATVVAELDVRDAADDLREEAAINRILRLFEHCMRVRENRHYTSVSVTQLND